MNLEMAYDVLDILQIIQDAVKQMTEEYKAGNIQQFNTLSMDIWDGLAAVQQIVGQETKRIENSRLRDACTCALESLKDIKLLVLRGSEETIWKLECELLTIVENAYLEFFCRRIVLENPDRREDFLEYIMGTRTYTRLALPPEERRYSCDLSIFMAGYNHLDYSRRCVKSIMDNIPKEIKCEVILYNHGSSDGTREYFESIPGVHVLNAFINRAFYTIDTRALGGKYSLVVSNDIIIGKNAIENMYRTLTEHDDYGWVVPSTPAVSNLQTIPAQYNSEEEFNEFAAKNNIYDERRHEMRVRLCNPIFMMPTDIYNQIQYDLYEQKYCVSNVSSFPDDKTSLWMRRRGYKNILAKDAYCHHFGSVTHKSDWKSRQEQEAFYNQGRKVFYDNFGIDPWGTGFCYDYQLFQDWKLPLTDNATVLGINCGIGSNSLKIKETLREMGSKNVILYNGVQEKRYLQDIQGVSDKAFLFEKFEDIIQKTDRKQFNFIIIEEPIYGCKQNEYVETLRKNGISFDEMAYRDEGGKWQIIDKLL